MNSGSDQVSKIDRLTAEVGSLQNQISQLLGEFESRTHGDFNSSILPPLPSVDGGSIQTGFEWLGADGATATIGSGYVVTFGRLIQISETNVPSTGSINSPGIIFVEAKRLEENYSIAIKCLASSSFPGHTVEAWRMPIYAVYLSSSGDARPLHKLTNGLVAI